MFFLAPMAFRTARDRRVLLGVLVVLGAYLGLTAVFETTGPHALVIPHYISNPNVGIHFGRARGPFLEGNANGLILFACGVAAAIASVTWTDRRRRRIAIAVALLCGLGILLTLTRGAWIAAAAGAVAALLCTRRTRRILVPGVALVAIVVLAALVAIRGFQSRASSRLNEQAPIWDRENSNDAALRMLAVHPLFGFGLGEFSFKSDDYYRQSPDYPLTSVRDVHNLYLALATELGLLGTGLWLLALLVGLGSSLQRRGPPNWGLGAWGWLP